MPPHHEQPRSRPYNEKTPGSTRKMPRNEEGKKPAGPSRAQDLDRKAGDEARPCEWAQLVQSRVGKTLGKDQLDFLWTKCGNSIDKAIDIYHQVYTSENVIESDLPATNTKRDERERSTDDDGEPSVREKVVHLDQFYDKAKMRWRLVKQTKQRQTTRKFERYVLLVRRVFSERMIYLRTEVVVQARRLRNILRGIFSKIGECDLSEDEQMIAPEFLFWAQPALLLIHRHLRLYPDTDLMFELEAAQDFCETHWPQMSKELFTMKQEKRISFKYLWAIVSPKTPLYGTDQLGNNRIWIVKHSQYDQKGENLLISALHIESDGHDIGFVGSVLSIPFFQGTRSLKELPYSPLHDLSTRHRIWKELVARTAKQLQFHGGNFKVQEQSGFGLIGDNPKFTKLSKFKFHGRVMIDTRMIQELHPGGPVPPVTELPAGLYDAAPLFDVDDMVWSTAHLIDPITGPNDKNATDAYWNNLDQNWDSDSDEDMDAFEPQKTKAEPETLPEYLSVLFSGSVYGYSFADGRWGVFSASRVDDVEWNLGIFNSLVMKEDLRDLMYKLVKAWSTKSSNFDDYVHGKGRGLIGLLHGPPGLGKTLTAEAIAETAKLPLYQLSSGALGHTPEMINTRLKEVLHLTSHWRAVLLIDEADVFLAKRDENNLERNAIVSVFLRELEYHPGIIMLTSNQAEIIDPAFESRIHFAHEYRALDKEARKKIWKNFVAMAGRSSQLDVRVDENGFEELARQSLNGRQIKNTMSLAVRLAENKDEPRVLTTCDIILTSKVRSSFAQKEHPPSLPAKRSSEVKTEKSTRPII